jgi:sugar lactone lactonase YvrE
MWKALTNGPLKLSQKESCYVTLTKPKDRNMNANVSKPANLPRHDGPISRRLFFLDLAAGRVLSVNTDGSDLKVLVEEGRKLPDGLAVDAAAGYLYLGNMGNLKADDGEILRYDLDGGHMTTIVPPGATFTPKQLTIDNVNDKLYWSDREGMRVMRANLDGSQVETLVDTSEGDARPGSDARKWCVGIAVDAAGGKIYWTQKGGDNAGEGRIFRANIDLPPGQTAARRNDIELLYADLPEPIDLELVLDDRMMYWTDRGDPPRGNTVNRASMDPAPGSRKEPEILLSHLMEGIGLALDRTGGRMFVTDFAGSLYSANLDGSDPKTLLFGQGNLTGLAYAELPVGHAESSEPHT